MTLVLSLLVPWFLGYHLIGPSAWSFHDSRLHPASRLGIGYLLGVFVFYCQFRLLLQVFPYSTALWGTLAGSLAIALVAWLAGQRAVRVVPGASEVPLLRWWRGDSYSYIFWFFLLLCTAHLVFAAIEVLYRPVFPWDAWLSWMYRAKAWYLAGNVMAMDPDFLWASGESTAVYSVAGSHYPSFVPFTALWSAVALGGWIENLVNLPTLSCALALSLAVFGLCREHGLSSTAAVIASYIVLSVPLIGAHISLAGEADIWMAGFAGVGYAALLSGLIAKRAGLIALGLGLVLMSLFVKVEGAVWMLGGLVITAVALAPRVSAVAGVALTLLAMVGWLYGVTLIDLPLLGKMGVGSGYLYASLLGRYTLQNYELGNDYLTNFFLGGSWHLLWTAVICAGVASVIWFKQRSSRIALLFFVTIAACQTLIFFFTDQGAWADDWTAINRLPLHFVPGLVVAVFCVAHAQWQRSLQLGRIRSATRRLRSRDIVLLAAAAFALTSGGSVLLLASQASSTSSATLAPALTFPGSKMAIVVGGGSRKGNTVNINRFDGNIAIASTGPIDRSAEGSALLNVQGSGSNRQDVTVFWRNADSGELFRATLRGLGDAYIDLRGEPGWGGRISELGLVFYDDGGSVKLHSVGAQAATLGGLLKMTLADWRWQTRWNQRSVNWIEAGQGQATFPLTLFVLGWLLAAALLCALLRRRMGGIAVFLPIAVLCWIAIDTRWLVNRTSQAGLTIHDYASDRRSSLRFGDDEVTRRAVAKAVCDMPAAGGRASDRMIIASNSSKDMGFQMLRGKYHALPVPVHVHKQDLKDLPQSLAGRVLVLKERYSAEGGNAVVSSADAIGLLKSREIDARVGWESRDAYLLLLGDSPAWVGCG